MRIGLDSFTLRDLKLDALDQVEWASEHGLSSIQFGGLGSDPAKLAAVKAKGDELGVETTCGIGPMNRHLTETPCDEVLAGLREQIERAAAAGWRELHGSLGADGNRYRHPSVPWTQQLEDAALTFEALGPTLRDCGCRVSIENHFDTTTFELVRLAERVGPDICGVCFDTANAVLFGEDIVEASRRVAPYAHLTHIKDFIVFFDEKGIRRQGFPPGSGFIEWTRVLPILHAGNPDLPLNIEDHKWLFSAEIFEDWWHDEQPDLPRRELARTVELAWRGQQEIWSGARQDPEEYEKIPHETEMEERVMAGKLFLENTLAELGL